MNARKTLRLASFAATVTALGWASEAQAAPDIQRRGGQIEGIIGGTGCIPGRASCKHDELVLDGGTRPSFGVGASLGFRPIRFFMIGALYRYGMFDPDYRVDSGPDYKSAGQHTVALMLRPIIPIWRFDLGFNVAPGFGRQVFRYSNGDRDISQGFSMLIGPTLDIFVTRNLFLGAEIDFIFNTQKKVCQVRDSGSDCTTNPIREVAPTHQSIYGFHIGGTFG